jgi:hypothetical protein
MPEGPRPFRLLPLPKPTAKPTARATAKPRLSPPLRVSASRLATFRAGSSGGAVERGLVVQAVLLTVMVTTIGLLAVASRVASSRQGAAASSLAAAARQAAEFGFSEIVAEMNRDAKAYLWVTPYARWQSVSVADLQACSIYTSTAPASNPIPGASSSVSLPGSSELSYQLTGYQEPASPGTATPASPCTTTFGNLRGGTATLTVVGRAQRSSGDQTSFTLKRTVSVRRAEPVFRRTIFQGPATQANLTGSDPRFPAFPTAADLGVSVTSGPNLICELATPSSAGGSKYTCNGESFDNSTNKFPYTSSTGSALATGCSRNPTNTQIVCQFSSLTLLNTTVSNIGVQMVVDVRPARPPVNIFINAPLNSPVTISANANLCSDSSGSTDVKSCLGTVASTSPSAVVTPTGSWSRLRLFGNALPTPSAPCNQPIQLNTSPDNSTIPVNRLNLQNAFLWFPAATLTYPLPPTLASLPAGLVGRVCSVAEPAATTPVASLSPNQVFDGLASIFTGGTNQPGAIRFLYRGFGSQEQRL